MSTEIYSGLRCVWGGGGGREGDGGMRGDGEGRGMVEGGGGMGGGGEWITGDFLLTVHEKLNEFNRDFSMSRGAACTNVIPFISATQGHPTICSYDYLFL